MAKLVIDYGADPNVHDEFFPCSTPLIFVCKEIKKDPLQNIKIAKLLLENGANPNMRDLTNYTPLYWAANYGHFTIVKLLLKYGAKDGYCKKNNTMKEYLNKMIIIIHFSYFFYKKNYDNGVCFLLKDYL
jgi:ankyrin repeat protein